MLDSLLTTLAIANRYHSSTISDAELAATHKMITRWDAEHAFPALDLARMAVLHPDAASSKRMGYWEEVLNGALDMCLGLGEVVNSYKGGSGSAGAAGSSVDRYVLCVISDSFTFCLKDWCVL